MRSILVLLFFVVTSGSIAREAETILNLKSELQDDSTVEDRLMIYNDLAWEYYTTNFDSSFYYVEKALALAKSEESNYWLAVSMEMKAILMEVSGDLTQAIKLYLDVIPIRTELGGVGLETTFNNMAIIFEIQGNDEKALEYYRKSHEIELKNENKSGVAGSLINIALSYKNMQVADSVAPLLNDALAIAQKAKDKPMIMHALLNLGDWYYQSDKPDSAMLFLGEVIPLSQELGDDASNCAALMGIAEIRSSEGNYAQAKLDYHEGLEMGIQLNSLDYQSRAHRGLSEVYKNLGQTKSALDELEQYLLLREKLLTEELVRSTNELEQKYESAKKEQEIAELELSAIEQNLLAAKNQNERRLLFLLAIVLIGVLGFVSYRFVNQRKVALLLKSKNETIAEALSDRELLLREIHHRVKNNLQVVSSLLSIQGREIQDEKARSAISESKNRVHSMALIHQFLYSDKELASIDMKEYIPNLCKTLFNAYKLDHDLIDLQVVVEPISLDIDTAIPLGIIINELITNSLKYAFEEADVGFINVSFAERQNQLVLTVKDNGKGMQDNDRSDISFGMKLIRAFEEKLQAEVKILGNDGFEVICTVGKYKRLWPKNTVS